jgi:hypothetical protein
MANGQFVIRCGGYCEKQRGGCWGPGGGDVNAKFREFKGCSIMLSEGFVVADIKHIISVCKSYYEGQDQRSWSPG